MEGKDCYALSRPTCSLRVILDFAPLADSSRHHPRLVAKGRTSTIEIAWYHVNL